MKFLLPLFLSLLPITYVGALDAATFSLGRPSFTLTDAQTISVEYRHGPGTQAQATQRYVVPGDGCPTGDLLPTPLDPPIPGIVVDAGATDPDISVAPFAYLTTYSFTLDLGLDTLTLSGALDESGDPIDGVGAISLCVIHTFSDDHPEGGDDLEIVPNFQETVLTIHYLLQTSEITYLTFYTAAHDPWAHTVDEAVTIGVQASWCTPTPVPDPDSKYAPTDAVAHQGQVICLILCPDPADDVGDDFKVTQLIGVGVAHGTEGAPTVGGPTQTITDEFGQEYDDSTVDILQPGESEDADCLKLHFFLDSSFFDIFYGDLVLVTEDMSAVTVSGTVLLADKAESSGRRLRSNTARALAEPTRVTDAQFEMDLQVAAPEGDSGSVAVTVARFAIAGAAGAALLI